MPAPNVLAARLKTLTAHGVLERETYSTRPLRQEYVLTAKGHDLFPVLAAMLAFGDRYVYGQGREPQSYTHLECGRRFEARIACAGCGKLVSPADLKHHAHPEAITVGAAFELADA